MILYGAADYQDFEDEAVVIVIRYVASALANFLPAISTIYLKPCIMSAVTILRGHDIPRII